ncbi:MAG: IS630 family transposase, partial [Gemmataceae bacterium]
MAIQLPDARALSDEALGVLRLRASRGLELGYTATDLADLLGVRRETISRWWAACRSDGLPSLPGDRTGRPQGSGRSLGDQQAQRIQTLIDGNTPEELGIPHALWTRRAVRALVRKEFGLGLAVRPVGLYLWRWGYTSKKPARHSRKQDPDEVKRWLEAAYPGIAARASREGAAVLWCDEVGVAADHHPGCGYARKGQRATVDVPRPHIRVNQIAATGNRGQVRFMTYEGSLDAAVSLRFLGKL